MTSREDAWPSLPLESWSETCATLHMWAQIVGKIRLVQSPWLNHSWHVTLYVTSRGLTTTPIPYGERSFQLDFNFIDHSLLARTSDGEARSIALRPRSSAQERRRHILVRARSGRSLVPDPRRHDPTSPGPCRAGPIHPAIDGWREADVPPPTSHS